MSISIGIAAIVISVFLSITLTAILLKKVYVELANEIEMLMNVCIKIIDKLK